VVILRAAGSVEANARMFLTCAFVPFSGTEFRRRIPGVRLIVDGVARLMQWKTRRKLVLLILMAGSGLLLPLVGCTKRAGITIEAPPKAYEGHVVKAASPDESLSRLLERHGSIWAKGTGARVEAKVYAVGSNPGSIKAASLWVIRPAELPKLAAE